MPTTKDIGNRGEEIASIYLQRQGFVIQARNWRTRWCEIDIIASKDGCIYFVEVKYRATSTFGTGLDYITAKKQQQMQFAAEFWAHQHKYVGDMQLAAISVCGDTGAVELIQID